MFKKLFMLFKIGRRLTTSGAISSIYEIYNPPIVIKILFFIIGFSLKNEKVNNNLSPGVKLCNALQEMGTTFIKLGQFLATRPDIIGENISKELERLQDKLPAFDLIIAKDILQKEPLPPEVWLAHHEARSGSLSTFNRSVSSTFPPFVISTVRSIEVPGAIATSPLSPTPDASISGP